MSFSSLTRSVVDLSEDFAVAHPETWIMSFAYIGLTIGVLFYAALGFFIGGLISHPLSGMWISLGYYTWWLATHVELLSSQIDHFIDEIRSTQ